MNVGFVWNGDHAAHGVQGHVERPERLDAAIDLLRAAGLLDRLRNLHVPSPSEVVLPPLHAPRYLDRLRQVCADGGGWFDPDTYCLAQSCDVARSAAGACLAATDAVLQDDVTSAFCAVRPPGHHARPAQAMGFCLLNNVALAAQQARTRHGVERIAIVDIDVHHGNGTQDAFYDDPDVLYVSTHQYPFYPGTGAAQETGHGPGVGANVNVALPPGCGDAQYAHAFDDLVEPVVRRHRPQLLLVSCGFDAHYADPLAGMALSIDGYGALAERLLALAGDLCEGRLVLVLEGGYDLDAVAWGVRRVVEVLLREPLSPDPHGPLPSGPMPDIEALLRDLRALHGLE